MKEWLKKFISTSNEINENVVIGLLLLLIVMISVFIPIVDSTKFYVLVGMTMACFGLGALKK